MSQGLNSNNIPSIVYHAGLSDEERTSVQERWLRNTHYKVKTKISSIKKIIY